MLEVWPVDVPDIGVNARLQPQDAIPVRLKAVSEPQEVGLGHAGEAFAAYPYLPGARHAEPGLARMDSMPKVQDLLVPERFQIQGAEQALAAVKPDQEPIG